MGRAPIEERRLVIIPQLLMQRCRANRQQKRGACAPRCRALTKIYLLLLPDSALADSAPMASAYLFPENRISFSDLWPSGFTTVTAESRLAARSRSTMRAGTVATIFLPCRIL